MNVYILREIRNVQLYVDVGDPILNIKYLLVPFCGNM